MTDASELFPVDVAAHRLGLCRAAVYAEIKSGRLPARRLGPRGGKIRLAEADLAVYLETCKAAPAKPAVRRAHRYIKTA